MKNKQRKLVAGHLKNMAERIMKGDIDVIEMGLRNNTLSVSSWDEVSSENIVTSSVLSIEYKDAK